MLRGVHYFFVLLMLGGVVNSNMFSPSPATMLVLLMG